MIIWQTILAKRPDTALVLFQQGLWIEHTSNQHSFSIPQTVKYNPGLSLNRGPVLMGSVWVGGKPQVMLIAGERTSRVRKTWLCSSSSLTRLINCLPIQVRDTRDKESQHLLDLPIPWAMGSSFPFFHPQFNKETPHSSSWLIHSYEYTVTLKIYYSLLATSKLLPT